jgi:Fur family ferric uptake transcriptional regulator
MQRDTSQRRAILDVVQEAKRPLSPQEILDRAKAALPKLGIATVYRTMKAMEEMGDVVPVDLPGDGRRYERAGMKHHHHFSCRNCSRVFDLEGCPGNIDRLIPTGFKLESHEILLYGLCDRCASA